jgi:copper chaperone CopZ|tara:strand:- start:975 stop:1199 length:225 start_codon:yes stop_codon:yes gene_type:complete
VVIALKAPMTTITLTVIGMTCVHCEKAVLKVIQSIDAQAQPTINRPAGTACITSEQPPHMFIAAIVNEGYSACL